MDRPAVLYPITPHIHTRPSKLPPGSLAGWLSWLFQERWLHSSGFQVTSHKGDMGLQKDLLNPHRKHRGQIRCSFPPQDQHGAGNKIRPAHAGLAAIILPSKHRLLRCSDRRTQSPKRSLAPDLSPLDFISSSEKWR